MEVGEEDRELEEEVKEDEKSGKGVDISKQASSRNISKSCSPPRFPKSSFSSVNISLQCEGDVQVSYLWEPIGEK